MKILTRIVVILGVLVLVTALALPFLIDVNQFRPKLESEPDLNGMAQAEVKDLKGAAGKAASGVLRGLLGGKKD